MILDQITTLAERLGIPHADLACNHRASRAGRILARIEALFLTDAEGTLGERFRVLSERTVR